MVCQNASRYFLVLAVADLMVLTFDVNLYEIKYAYFPYSFLNYIPICSLNLALLVLPIDCSLWLTAVFTFDRFVALCCQNIRTKYCTEKTATKVITVVCFSIILQNAPIYFINEPLEIIEKIPLHCAGIPAFTPSKYTSTEIYINRLC